MATVAEILAQENARGERSVLSINRTLLRSMVLSDLALSGPVDPLLQYLTDIITLKDPLDRSRVCGSRRDWGGLPDSKCLYTIGV